MSESKVLVNVVAVGFSDTVVATAAAAIGDTACY